ncbi:LysR family transcriptional regulator [Bacteriovorax stolpii]|uniref:LysR family transcriptional regulator n=1 Tax=Bacteriovorax stolpii TaxID=960 RepID=A0A2K9NNQ5_BACTC|nr:LysR family transcriptional regulator [Bacteriovorax stolpii]AUN97133.1 LysR family transcriptional regulator [Bacteriovorax stolpii]TDP53419.1 LysR family transcriptional regulator [Bacteriovorax stolpii]
MDRFYSMQIFVRVAELNSFTKAAESLGLPKASVSTYVQQLESQVGTRLFHRTTRNVQLTNDGLAFYERCKDLLMDVEETEGMFRDEGLGVKGRIRVDMPVALSRNVVIPRLPEFLKENPQVELEISSTDRRVDLIQEGFDCVVRVGNLADSGLIARPIGEMKVINCASPQYLKKYGTPKKLEDLSGHLLVHYTLTLGGRPFGFEYFEDGKYKTMKMKGTITVNSTEAYQSACLSGLGIIQAPEVGLRDLIKKQKLQEILPKIISEPMPVSIVYPNRRNLPRRVKVFMDWLDDVIKDYINH